MPDAHDGFCDCSDGRESLSLLSADQVAELLRVPKSWVYAETRAGRMPHVVLGRYRRYRRTAIDEWVTARERGPVVGPVNREPVRERPGVPGDSGRGSGCGSVGGSVRAGDASL